MIGKIIFPILALVTVVFFSTGHLRPSTGTSWFKSHTVKVTPTPHPRWNKPELKSFWLAPGEQVTIDIPEGATITRIDWNKDVFTVVTLVYGASYDQDAEWNDESLTFVPSQYRRASKLVLARPKSVPRNHFGPTRNPLGKEGYDVVIGDWR
jgi:hypothetical protein